MDFVFSAFSHAISWDYCAGFMVTLFVGGCVRLIWRVIRHD